MRLTNTKVQDLGNLDIVWRSYFGEHGSMKIGPFRNQVSSSKEKVLPFEVEMVDRETCLLLETPQTVRFRLHNRTAGQARYSLEINEAVHSQGDTLICGIYPQTLRVEQSKSVDFQLELFAKSCGVSYVQGLRVRDETAKAVWDVQRTKLTVNYSDKTLR